MTRRENLKAKALQEDEEEEVINRSKLALSTIISDDSEEEEERKRLRSTMYEESDDEVIEDPMSKIVEKSLLVCEGNKIDQNNNDFDVVSITRADGVVEFPSIGAVKMKEEKKQSVRCLEVEGETVIAMTETEKDETNGIQEGVEKEEKVEMVALEGSANPDAVDQTDNIVMRKLLRGPRYFNPPDSGWSTCFNCGEEGHMAVKCPSLKKRKKPCFVCGGFDHGAKQCPKGQDCFICKQGGHRAKDCPDKRKGSQPVSKICLKCRDEGHDMFSCRNNYSEDDLKEIRCYICKNFGHLCCVFSVNDSPKEVSCYKCGELGHSGLACLRLREDADNDASPSSCFRCHQVGHFARECTRSTKGVDSGAYSGSCRKCGDVGHFARECTSVAKQNKKRNRELSAPSRKATKEKGKPEVKSAPPEREKGRKRKKRKSEGKGVKTPQKSKHLGEVSNSKGAKYRRQSSKTPPNAHKIRSITSGSYASSSRSPKKVQNHYQQTPRYGVQNHYPSTSPYAARNHYPGTSPYGMQNRYPPVQNHYPGTPPYPVRNHFPGTSPYAVQNHHHGSSPYDHRHTAPRYDHKFTASRFDNSTVRHNNFHDTGERRYYDW